VSAKGLGHGASRLAYGRIDEALDTIERAIQDGYWLGGALDTDPALEPLRSHPRFAALKAEAPSRREAFDQQRR
jgi:hypothetical protein